MGATFLTATNSTKKPWDADKRAPFILENEIDFSDFATKPVQNDIVEALAIPADTLVLRAWVEVETGETGAADEDFGVTGDDADGFLDGITIATTGKKDGAGTEAYPSAGGKVFRTADTIDHLCKSAVTYDAGKYKIKALCIDLS
jgi:hypothetical protein